MWKHEETITIGVAPEQVWKAIADVALWEEWNAVVREAALHDSELVVGASIKVECADGSILSGVIADMIPNVLLNCTFSVTGAVVDLVFDVEELEEGVLVRYRMSGEGLLGWYMTKSYKKHAAEWLSLALKNLSAYIAQVAERLVPEEAPVEEPEEKEAE